VEQNRWSAQDDEEDAVEEDINEVQYISEWCLLNAYAAAVRVKTISEESNLRC
jgi:hypothetical protein